MQKRSETGIFIAVFFFWFSVYTYPSFLSDMVVGMGGTAMMAGIITGSYGLTQMILRIPLGVASDVLKKRKLFVMLGFAASMLASAGLSLAALYSHGAGRSGSELFAWILISRALSGVAASTWVTLTVLYAAGYERQETNAAMSRLMLPQYGSQVIAMVLGAQLAQHVGEGYAFLLAFAAGLAGLIAMCFVKEVPPTGEPLSFRGAVSVLKDRNLIAGSVLSIVMHLVCWATVLGFTQNWARDVIGLSKGELGYLSLMYLLPNMVVARFSGDHLARRFGRRGVLVAGFLAMAAACLLFPATKSALGLFAVQALMGAGMGMIVPLTLSSAISGIPSGQRSTAMGVYQAVYGIGMFLGPVIAGAVISAFSRESPGAEGVVLGYAANFRFFFGVSMAGAVAAFFIIQDR